MDEEEERRKERELAYVKAAFLAMEPADCVISLARWGLLLLSLSPQFGGGYLTLGVQSFILNNCIKCAISQVGALSHAYIKNILRKVISTVESSGHEVLEDLYEFYAHYMSSFKENMWLKDGNKIQKSISFFISNGCDQEHSNSSNLVIPILCSSNMLEGDTGCCIWPSSLFLSEFILSYPNIFLDKYCLEVGSGVGLVGVILSKMKASKVVLTDGDLSTLANMQANLELSHIASDKETQQVECRYLSWEAASESELKSYRPDIVLGADVIYDPLCLPHLVRVLASLLKPNSFETRSSDGNGLQYDQQQTGLCEVDSSQSNLEKHSVREPVAYVATVIRNVETFDHFLRLACQANLAVVDITKEKKPLNLLPYVTSYDRSSVKLYMVTYSQSEVL